MHCLEPDVSIFETQTKWQGGVLSLKNEFCEEFY